MGCIVILLVLGYVGYSISGSSSLEVVSISDLNLSSTTDHDRLVSKQLRSEEEVKIVNDDYDEVTENLTPPYVISKEFSVQNEGGKLLTDSGEGESSTRFSAREREDTVYGSALLSRENVLEPFHKKEGDVLSDHTKDGSSADVSSGENITGFSQETSFDEIQSDASLKNTKENSANDSENSENHCITESHVASLVDSAMKFIVPEKFTIEGTELSIIPLAIQDRESSEEKSDSVEESLGMKMELKHYPLELEEDKNAYPPERLVMDEADEITSSFKNEDVERTISSISTTETRPVTIPLISDNMPTREDITTNEYEVVTDRTTITLDLNSLTTDTSTSSFRIQDNFTNQSGLASTTESEFVSDLTATTIDTVEEITNKSDLSKNISEDLPMAEKYYSHYNERVFLERNPTENVEWIKRNESVSEHLRDFEDKSEEDKVVLKSLLDDYPSFKKEKIEPGVLFEECPDCDLRVLPIRPSEQRSTPEQEESLPPSIIRFADLPEGSELQIIKLGLSDGIFLFSYLSQFLSWIQPNDFPVDLLRDALKSQISWVSLITQSLQVEAGFVACLVVGVLLALAVPVVVLSHTCYRMGGGPDNTEEASGWAGNCRRRTLVFILQILLVLLLAGVVAMFVTNEQLSSAVVQSSEVLQTSLADVSGYVHDSHLQLHFLVTQSMDQAIQAIYSDLDNVDSLLGGPIQRELVRETGLDVALDTLGDLTRETKEITQQVERFLDELRVTQEMLSSSREKLSDLRQQVELFRRACGLRDRALCDSIDASGLDITLRLDRMKSDEKLNKMKRMGGVGLEVAIKEAKERFMTVPNRVDTDTRDDREAVRRQLARQRVEVESKSDALEKFSRSLTNKVNEAKYQTGFWMEDVDQIEYWRWIACVGGGAAVLMIWMMLLCSMCCGCCGSERAAGPTILLTVVLVCLFSTVLWMAALVGLLVGGHGEVFLCRPLYDEPEYDVISRLVDEPGVFYSDQRGGFIANVIYGNDSLDVPIKQVLQDCQNNRPIYSTLGLDRVFDVQNAVDPHRWGSVSTQLRSIRANLSSLEVLSPHLQNQLVDLLGVISVNFTEHRIQMSKPLTGKDLDSFSRQLDNIGNQMRDLATASRMETLSSRTRRLIDTHIRPLEGKKDALVYQLTALEVQTGPLQRQVNQSLSHLKTIQFFVNSQGEAIAQRKSREYVERMVSYLNQLRRHVVESVQQHVAPCRPLWDIFNNTRLFLCRHTMDPLNGYWFATMWCLVVLLAATPVCLKLVDYYRAQGSRTSGSPEGLMGAEQGNGWSSPGYDINHSKESNGFVK